MRLGRLAGQVAWGAAVAFAGGSPAWAVTGRQELAPSAALECLTPAWDQRGLPEYPLEEFKRSLTGEVEVELMFDTPTSAPAVTVIVDKGGDAFVDSVKRHVRAWRVPCLDPAVAPVRLRFQFGFRPDDRRIFASNGKDLADESRLAMLTCVRHESGRAAPAYPDRALYAQVAGRVLAELSYDAPDRPPKAVLHARPSARLLVPAVQSWVEGLRMPCHQGRAVKATVVYSFQFAGEPFGFKPNQGFKELFGLMPVEDRRRIPSDTTAMGCPFDVNLVYRQPIMSNRVWQVGDHEPSRAPVVEWLRSVRLDLPSRLADSVFGDELTFTIPCLKIE